MKLKDLKLQIAALAGQFRLQIEAECDGFNPNPEIGRAHV